jgi:hypothetical protein
VNEFERSATNGRLRNDTRHLGCSGTEAAGVTKSVEDIDRVHNDTSDPNCEIAKYGKQFRDTDVEGDALSSVTSRS